MDEILYVNAQRVWWHAMIEVPLNEKGIISADDPLVLRLHDLYFIWRQSLNRRIEQARYN